MNAVSSKKAELRRAIRARLLSHVRTANANRDLIAAIAETSAFKKARKVGLFVARPWEPDLFALWQLRPEACVFPRVVETTLVFHAVEDLGAFAPGYRGILEPPGQSPTTEDWDETCLILVPGVAFDRRGGRLGSGAGFYDRFCETNPSQRWGVGWHFQTVEDELAQEATDARMGALANELGIFEVAGVE